jgi:hypothetical protein
MMKMTPKTMRSVSRIKEPRWLFLMTTSLGSAFFLSLSAWGFAQFGFRLRLIAGFLAGMPGYVCAFSKLLGRPRRKAPPAPEIRLNLEIPRENPASELILQ